MEDEIDQTVLDDEQSQAGIPKASIKMQVNSIDENDKSEVNLVSDHETIIAQKAPPPAAVDHFYQADQERPNLDIDFIVDSQTKEPDNVSLEIKDSKPKRYFSAKPIEPELLIDKPPQPKKEKVIALKPKEIKKPSKDTGENDWVLSRTEEVKKAEAKKSSCKLLFDVYDGDKVHRTLYSTHARVLDHSSWPTMYELISGRFKDGDFEPSMSHLVGHQKVKTEKDKLKL